MIMGIIVMATPTTTATATTVVTPMVVVVLLIIILMEALVVMEEDHHLALMHRLHRQLLDHLIHMETIMVLDLVKILLVLMPNQPIIHHILTHHILDQL